VLQTFQSPLPEVDNVTNLLDQVRHGDTDAFSNLIGRIYNELRIIARGQRRKLGASETVNTTALVHEAYQKLADSNRRHQGLEFSDRGHFFRVASRVMRDVIVDYIRAQNAEKRGGAFQKVSADTGPILPNTLSVDPHEILTVHSALEELGKIDEDAAKVAELKYFAGLTNEETAAAMSISVSTVKRNWVVARGWMYKHLKS